MDTLLSVPVKATALVVAPLHNDWLVGWAMDGTGLTVIENIFDGPLQPAALGVTVMPATAMYAPLLDAVNEGILPVPLAGRPIMVPVFVHV